MLVRDEVGGAENSMHGPQEKLSIACSESVFQKVSWQRLECYSVRARASDKPMVNQLQIVSISTTSMSK